MSADDKEAVDARARTQEADDTGREDDDRKRDREKNAYKCRGRQKLHRPLFSARLPTRTTA